MQNRKNICIFVKKVYNNLCFRTAAAGIMALAWWGVLYPELCFTENTCVQVIISQGQEIVLEQTDYQGILSASGDEVIVRSRLLEWLEQQKNKKQNKE
ncbi:MAG: hypothetical protein K2L82_08735 [Lachnospiraceae bacterium]|nr:hypothetical protein [Lachnospiraceae bacterium]